MLIRLHEMGLDMFSSPSDPRGFVLVAIHPAAVTNISEKMLRDLASHSAYFRKTLRPIEQEKLDGMQSCGTVMASPEGISGNLPGYPEESESWYDEENDANDSENDDDE